MKFDPKDAEFPVLPEGDYDALVKDAEDKQSKAGNDMIKLTVQVYHGSEKYSFDTYLASAFAAKAFCEATGLQDLFAAGELTPAYCIGKAIRVTMKHETYQGEKRSKIDKIKARPGVVHERVQPTGKPSDALDFAPAAAPATKDEIPW
jgi:hypothetical protein